MIANGIIASGSLNTPRFRDLVMDLGPYLYYPMDEDTGSLTTIEEIVQGQNVTGGPFASWGEPLVEGDSASAVFANGQDLATSGYISTNITNFSYMAILKPIIINVRAITYAVDADNWWNFDIKSGTVAPYTYNIVDAEKHNAPISVGERVMVIVTFDDSANRVYFYKNGSQVSTSIELKAFTTRSAIVRLGNRVSGTSGYSGSMSHVAYFERVLTPTEVSDLWTAAG